jgi:hypothetical protein
LHRQSAAASLAAALLLLAGHGSQLPALSYFPAAHAWHTVSDDTVCDKVQSVAVSLRAGELVPAGQGVHDNCLGVNVPNKEPSDILHCVETSQIVHPLGFGHGLDAL